MLTKKTSDKSAKALFFVKKDSKSTILKEPWEQESEPTLMAQRFLTSIAQEPAAKQTMWQDFCHDAQQFISLPAERLLVLKTAFQCAKNPVQRVELAQLIIAVQQLKAVSGLGLLHRLFTAQVPVEHRCLRYYLTICQLLSELHDMPGIMALINQTLPDLNQLSLTLKDKHLTYLAAKYPERSLDSTIARFQEKNASVQYPLSAVELTSIKQQYLTIKQHLATLSTLTSAQLTTNAQQASRDGGEQADMSIIAVLIETIRRIYKIAAYDTQILSLLALLNSPTSLKGRLAQIKTGEGKSTIIAMLVAFKALHGHFVDVVTSSSYLAKREWQKYQPFYQALGLPSSYISKQHVIATDFHGQIIFGTNTDFEFAMLREGLYNQTLRQSYRNGQLVARTFDVVIVDEVDNLFLDAALNSARLAISGRDNIAWVYERILMFVTRALAEDPTLKHPASSHMIMALRRYLIAHTDINYQQQIEQFSASLLKHWLINAYSVVSNEKRENYHYWVRESTKVIGGKEIVIVDYAHTGRLNEGCQWQGGLHQFLQAKHHIPVTPESLTAASLSHPTYFTLYQECYGLTGTMGERSERDEIQTIYHIDSVDIPPHYPSKRIRLASQLLPDRFAKHQALIAQIVLMQQHNRPILLLFKTIDESYTFSQALKNTGLNHQLLNETQQESEDFIVARAGHAGSVTIATNTAGRGTDIILSPDSKAAGGLHQVFAFYPDTIRDEGQGFGRAARQNDPGSCCIIIDEQDETLTALLAGENVLSLVQLAIEHAVCDGRIVPVMLSAFVSQTIKSPLGFLLEHGRHADDTPCSADDMLLLIEQLRTKTIEKQSAQRLHASQIEAVFFTKMQAFFQYLAAIAQQFEQPVFKALVIQRCEQGRFEPLSVASDIEFNSDWSTIIDTVKQLAHNQRVADKNINTKTDLPSITMSNENKIKASATVDWSNFYEQFKQTYLNHLRRQWASFYSQLHETNEDCSMAQLSHQVAEQYRRFISQLGDSSPEKNIMALLNQLLHLASNNAVESLSTKSKDQSQETRKPLTTTEYFLRHPLAVGQPTMKVETILNDNTCREIVPYEQSKRSI